LENANKLRKLNSGQIHFKLDLQTNKSQNRLKNPQKMTKKKEEKSKLQRKRELSRGEKLTGSPWRLWHPEHLQASAQYFPLAKQAQ
jgi:hypothetical protein